MFIFTKMTQIPVRINNKTPSSQAISFHNTAVPTASSELLCDTFHSVSHRPKNAA